jgi:PAS domain S-box-containing protein
MLNLSRRFMDLRIRYKLLLGYSTMFIISCALASVIIYVFVRDTIAANIESELKNSTTTILNMVRASADVSIKNHLRAVAEKNREITEHFYRMFKDGQMSEKEAKLRTHEVLLSQTIGKTGYIYCLDSNGRIVMHPKNELLGVDLSPYAFIKDQKKRKSGYLEYDWKNPGEEQVRAKALYMTYFAPWDWIISVSSYRGEFKELVNVEDFRERILALKFGQTGYSYVIDSQGNLIIHPLLEGQNILHEKDPRGRMFIKALCEQKSGKMTYAWRNPGETIYRKKLVIFNDIPEFDWIVASSSYQDEFYAPLQTVQEIFMATVAVCLVLVLPFTLYITGSITHPLRELMHRFSEAADGDTSVRLTSTSRDEVGVLARYFNSFMDRLQIYSDSLKTEIADRKRAEAAIRKSEAKYRELVENANSIILRMDNAGRITFFNEFAQRFFGFGEAEIIGKNVIGTIVPENSPSDASPASFPLMADEDGDRTALQEIPSTLRDGRQVWVAWTRRAILDRSGQTTELLCVGTDITESKAAEQEMARMRHYLKNLVDAMPSVLVGVDAAGRVTQWNQGAVRLTGERDDQAAGRPVVDMLPLLAPHMTMVTTAIRQGASRQVEKAICRHGGNTFYADIMVYPIQSGDIQGAVIRVDDVTQRVRMETMMVQTEKMMSVGGLAAGMAHEINNPLGGMLQSLQNVIRRISPDLPANQSVARQCGTRLETIRRYLEEREILRFLENIRISGERAARIVDNMLSFSRRSESRKQPVRLSELLDKAVELAAHDYDLKKKYDFRHIRIQRHDDARIGEVPCVATEIEQVLLNLLRNAAQAMGDAHGQLELPCIILRLRRENEFAVIEVADNGPGMDETRLKRIFEPFFTTKEVGFGTGLGLSVAYFIITNNHNGSMSAESSPGKGANFIIRLPLADPLETASEAGEPGSGTGFKEARRVN